MVVWGFPVLSLGGLCPVGWGLLRSRALASEGGARGTERADVHDSHLDTDWGCQRGGLDVVRTLEDLADGPRALLCHLLAFIRIDLAAHGATD